MCLTCSKADSSSCSGDTECTRMEQPLHRKMTPLTQHHSLYQHTGTSWTLIDRQNQRYVNVRTEPTSTPSVDPLQIPTWKIFGLTRLQTAEAREVGHSSICLASFAVMLQEKTAPPLSMQVKIMAVSLVNTPLE